MAEKRTHCAVVYNQVGEDDYARLRNVDPATLPFKPRFPIHVATEEEEYAAIAQALEQAGFEAQLFNVEDHLERLLDFLRAERPEVVFNQIDYFRGNPHLEYALVGVFDLCGIPYTGSTPFTLGLCQRKALTKRLLLQAGIPTPRFKLLRTPAVPQRHGLRYPIIVKPAQEDASQGVGPTSVVRDRRDLGTRVQEVYEKFKQPVMIEEFIEGREVHVSILGNAPPRALPVLEYDFSNLPAGHPSVITYDVKWNPLEPAYHCVVSRCPAQLRQTTERRTKRAALQAYLATGCRDYARIDLRISMDERPYVLEVNPNPDLTAGVSFMDSAEKAGLSFSETLRRIVELALARRLPAAAAER